jgi:hypothetical protein
MQAAEEHGTLEQAPYASVMEYPHPFVSSHQILSMIHGCQVFKIVIRTASSAAR